MPPPQLLLLIPTLLSDAFLDHDVSFIKTRVQYCLPNCKLCVWPPKASKLINAPPEKPKSKAVAAKSMPPSSSDSLQLLPASLRFLQISVKGPWCNPQPETHSCSNSTTES